MYLTKKKKLFWFLILVFFIFVLFLNLIYYIFLKSNLFKIKEIQINDIDLISKEIAFENLKKEIVISDKLKSLIDEDNLFYFLNVKKEKILPKLIYFEDFDIKTNFLKKQVIINFKEKKAIGIFCFLNDFCYFFDEKGYVFKKAPYLKGGVILKIYSNNLFNLVLGQKLFQEEEYLLNILKVYNSLKENGFVIKKIVLKDLKYKEFEVYLVNDLIFKFSLDSVPNDFDLIIKKIKQEIDFSKVKNYIDFRIENRIFYY